jgi:SprT-like family
MENNVLPGDPPTVSNELEDLCSLNGQKFPTLDDRANSSVRDAATGDSEWGYSGLLSFLYKWADIFNHEFFSGLLPQPVISLEKTRRNYGHFVPGRNFLGLKFNVNLNRVYLGRSEAELLETLVHEQIHLLQEITSTAGKGNYHNKEFVQKATEIGLQVELGRGCHYGSPTDPFVSLLRKHGVSFEPRVVRVEPPHAKAARPRLRRWSCRCKSVWCGGKLKAMCLLCEQDFQPNPT